MKRAASIKKLRDILIPSTISSALCVSLSLVVALGAIFVNRYRPGTLGLQYGYSPSIHTFGDRYLSGTLLTNPLVQNLYRLALIALLLLVLILLMVDLMAAAKPTSKKDQTKSYLEALGFLAIRLVVLVIYGALLSLYFNDVLSYGVQSAILMTTASDVLGAIGYLILTVIIISIANHLNVIFLRAIFLKRRILSGL